MTVNDGLLKLAAREVPGAQVVFMRGLVIIVLAGALAVLLGAFHHWRLLVRQGQLVALRNIGEVGATLFYVTALVHMQISDATAILQALPLVTVAGAALFLGEPVGWRRWLATAVGLLGVLIIIRPGTSAFNPWSLMALAAVGFITLRDLATRRIDKGVPTLLLTLLSGIAVSGVAGALSVAEGWQMPQTRTVLLAGGAAVFVMVGYALIIHAMRHGEVAVVAPFRYSVILWAIIIGWLMFGERPDPLALAGTAVVMLAGLYTFLRERQLAIQRGQR